MARKKKTEEATAAVVDAAPVAEVLETEQAAPVEVVEEAPQAEQAEQAAEVIEEKPADDGMGEFIEVMEAMMSSDRPMITIPAGFEVTYVEAEEADEGPSPEEIRAAEVRAERARLAEMWRMGGVAELQGIGDELRDVLRGIKARPDVHRPAALGEQVLTTAELIKALEEAGGDWAPVLRRWYRANHRRAGTSIYVQLALAELDEEGVDEPGQGQDEGSAGV